MVARSTVTFAELQQLLIDLGFTQSRRRKFWYFEQATSQTTVMYRPYKMRERVTLLDIDRTRRHLDLRGVLDEQAFDDRLKKATA